MDDSLNPYASPLVAESLEPTLVRPSGPPFNSAHGRAIFAVVMLAGMALVSVIGIVTCISQNKLLTGVKQGHPIEPGPATENDRQYGAAVMLQLVGYFATGLIFFLWIYRAHKNLPSLGAPKLEFTPGWAVGWFFVPFANLVRPYQVTQEIAKVSDPEGIGYRRVASSPLVTGWWLFFLARNIGGYLISTTFSVSDNARPSLDWLITGTNWQM